MTKHTTTPAGRLASLLADAAAAVKTPDMETRKTGEIWAEVLEVEYDSDEYMKLVVELNVLIVDLIASVNKTQDSVVTDRAKSIFSSRLRSLHAYFSSQMGNPWKGTQGYINKRNIEDIFMLDSQMRAVEASPYMSVADISDLRTEIDSLFEELDKCSEIPEELLVALRHNAEVMRRIIVHYRIYGSEKLFEAINRAIGEMVVLLHDKFKDCAKEPILQRFKEFLSKLAKKSGVMDRIASGLTIGDTLLGG